MKKTEHNGKQYNMTWKAASSRVWHGVKDSFVAEMGEQMAKWRASAAVQYAKCIFTPEPEVGEGVDID